MPATTEKRPSKAGRKKKNSTVVPVQGEAAEIPVTERVNYPNEIVIDEVGKKVNLSWFANMYRISYVRQAPAHLDYDLAVYCIAKHLPDVRMTEWGKFMDINCHKEPEIAAVFETMRNTYLKVHPSFPDNSEDENAKKKGWSFTVKDYLRKLLRNASVEGVTYLFLVQLMGLYDLAITREKALMLLNNQAPWRINDRFSGKPEGEYAKYGLFLPTDLLTIYTGKGFSYSELQWACDPAALIRPSEPPAKELVETDDQKSSISWKLEIEKLQLDEEKISEGLNKRRQAVFEAEQDLYEVRAKLEKCRAMLVLAEEREQLLTLDGSTDQKLKHIKRIKQVRDLIEDLELSDKDAQKMFVKLRQEERSEKTQDISGQLPTESSSRVDPGSSKSTSSSTSTLPKQGRKRTHSEAFVTGGENNSSDEEEMGLEETLEVPATKGSVRLEKENICGGGATEGYQGESRKDPESPVDVNANDQNMDEEVDSSKKNKDSNLRRKKYDKRLGPMLSEDLSLSADEEDDAIPGQKSVTASQEGEEAGEVREISKERGEETRDGGENPSEGEKTHEEGGENSGNDGGTLEKQSEQPGNDENPKGGGTNPGEPGEDNGTGGTKPLEAGEITDEGSDQAGDEDQILSSSDDDE